MHSDTCMSLGFSISNVLCHTHTHTHTHRLSLAITSVSSNGAAGGVSTVCTCTYTRGHGSTCKHLQDIQVCRFVQFSSFKVMFSCI